MNMTPMMENLVGLVDFTEEQLDEVDRTMDQSAGPMPSFAQFSGDSVAITPTMAVAGEPQLPEPRPS